MLTARRRASFVRTVWSSGSFALKRRFIRRHFGDRVGKVR